MNQYKNKWMMNLSTVFLEQPITTPAKYAEILTSDDKSSLHRELK